MLVLVWVCVYVCVVKLVFYSVSIVLVFVQGTIVPLIHSTSISISGLSAENFVIFLQHLNNMKPEVRYQKFLSSCLCFPKTNCFLVQLFLWPLDSKNWECLQCSVHNMCSTNEYFFTIFILCMSFISSCLAVCIWSFRWICTNLPLSPKYKLPQLHDIFTLY